MTVQLRGPQERFKADILKAFSDGHRGVLAVLPTGGGKTVIFSRIAREEIKVGGRVAVVAHRKELVGQISVALAREGVYHSIMGPPSLAAYCRARQLQELDSHYVHSAAEAVVVSIDTLARRRQEIGPKLRSVTLWIQDEAHHMLRENKWGLVFDLMPRARGLGVTATPRRSDGRGLGAHADGVFTALVEGPRMRALIEAGWLCEYQIATAPGTSFDVSNVPISETTGDYAQRQLVLTMRKQRAIFGGIVANYQRLAAGKRAIAFCTDVESAKELAADFRGAGVPAEALSARTEPRVRDASIARFKQGDLSVLTNVGLFDEGFDVPGVECVLDAAPTQSLARFDQKFGRMLRIAPGKTHGLYIDFVGNVARHYPPDTRPDINPARRWTLDAREKRSKPDEGIIPSRVCPQCTAPYPRIFSECPYCGFRPPQTPRATLDQIDGDLTLLDPQVLEGLRETRQVDEHDLAARMHFAGAEPVAIMGATKRVRSRNLARASIGAAIETWGAARRRMGVPADQAYREFFFRFGMDVLSAQNLPANETFELERKILTDIGD